ncbi:hypothetical protein BCS71_25780 [Vibrio lentus]|uniref:hypothetical protein n=1 Tax=Vibrio lentus TaxID=136468 RepID=UPI000C8172B2|nr:hypothetical protein [Vibrio lentus]PMI58318.1 hypothetical protein BCU41_03850 [Vibrio lentus]
MTNEIDPKPLTWPIKPSIIVDEFKADALYVSLSPEISLASFSLKQCFDGVRFKDGAKEEWAKQLRALADSLDK